MGDRGPTAVVLRGWLLALLGACAPEEPLPGACGEAPSVEFGSGTEHWHPIQDGDGSMMVHGPQDGWHFLAGAEVRGLSGMLTAIFDAVDQETGVPVANTPYRWDLVESEPCAGRSGSLYAFIDVRWLAQGDHDTPPEVLTGRPVDLHLMVGDEDGRSARRTITVIAELDPVDLPSQAR